VPGEAVGFTLSGQPIAGAIMTVGINHAPSGRLIHRYPWAMERVAFFRTAKTLVSAKTSGKHNLRAMLKYL